MQSKQNWTHWRGHEKFLLPIIIFSQQKQAGFLASCLSRPNCRPYMKTRRIITEHTHSTLWSFKKWTQSHVRTQWTYCWIVLKKSLTHLIKIGRCPELLNKLTPPVEHLVKSTWKNDRRCIYRQTLFVAF